MIPLLPDRGSEELEADLRSKGHDNLAIKATEVVSCQVSIFNIWQVTISGVSIC